MHSAAPSTQHDVWESLVSMDEHEPGSFYDAPAPLPPEAAPDPDAAHAPADLDSFLARLGPPPSWGIPAHLRAVLAHAYRAAARWARAR